MPKSNARKKILDMASMPEGEDMEGEKEDMEGAGGEEEISDEMMGEEAATKEEKPKGGNVPFMGKVNTAIDSFKSDLVEGGDEKALVSKLVGELQAALGEGSEEEEVLNVPPVSAL